jgi:hypothetical protein
MFIPPGRSKIAIGWHSNVDPQGFSRWSQKVTQDVLRHMLYVKRLALALSAAELSGIYS